MHQLRQNIQTFKIEERRRKVASLLAQSMTETEIAEQLNVDQSTINLRYANVVVVGCSVQRFSLSHYVGLKKRLRLLLHLAALQELQA